jgi:hypothetical protein
MERMTQPLFNAVKAQEGVPQALLDAIDAIEKERGESTFLGRLFGFVGLLIPFVTGGLAPLGRSTGYVLDYNMRTARPAPAETVDLYKRGLLTEDQFKGTMGELGVTLPHIEAILKLYDDNASPDDLIFGYLRGLFGETEFRQRMVDAGIPGNLHDIYIEQAQVIPPVQDLIRFMVRESFNEQAISKYGLSEDYPEQINEFLAKLGLSADWGAAYWAAHWQLPSPNQVFEMLHRGILDQNEVDDFLKFADYSPFWREKMRNISYNIVTRVDLRRLFQAGLVDRDYVLRNYKAQGYSDEDAELLTQFAETGTSRSERDLTKADVIGLYKDGLQSRGDTADDLVKMGYDDEEAEDLLVRADFDIQKALKTDTINYIEERYKGGQLDRNGAGNELSLAGLEQISVDRYLIQWDRQIETSKAVPSNAEAKRLFVADVITEDDFRQVLQRRNYEAQYIDWFVREAQQIKSPPPEEENA